MRRSKLKSLVREELYRILNEESDAAAGVKAGMSPYLAAPERPSPPTPSPGSAGQDCKGHFCAMGAEVLALAKEHCNPPASYTSRAYVDDWAEIWHAAPVSAQADSTGKLPYKCVNGPKQRDSGPTPSSGAAISGADTGLSLKGPSYGEEMTGEELFRGRARCPRCVYKKVGPRKFTINGRQASPKQNNDLNVVWDREHRMQERKKSRRSVRENRLRAKRAHRVLNRLMGKIGKG